MAMFVTRLKLYCNSTKPDALAEFDKRWTRRLEREWLNLIVLASDPGDLKEKLDTILLTDCDSVLVDVSCKADVSGVTSSKTFGGTVWTPGNDGLHEGRRQIMFGTSSGDKPWTFDAGGTVTISVQYTWDERTTRP